MRRGPRVEHEFVEFIPNELATNRLFISIPYATVVHLCLCGCGERVVTPLSPTDWDLGFDGETVSLNPSIGNWSFDCQSHYWIKHSRVIWSDRWSRGKIEAGRARDQWAKQLYSRDGDSDIRSEPTKESGSGGLRGWLRRLAKQ